jgi:hypothetical protein
MVGHCGLPQERGPLLTVQEGRLAPVLVWMGVKTLITRIQFPDRPACSELLYRLCYLDSHKEVNCNDMRLHVDWFDFNKQYQHWMVLTPKAKPLQHWVAHKTPMSETGILSHLQFSSDRSLVLTLTLLLAEVQS